MRRTFSLRQYWVLLGLAFILTVSTLWASQAAQGQRGQGQPAQGQRGQQTPEQQALQQARVGYSVTMELGNVNTGLRKFEAGKRTYWHSHDGGFIFFVQGGRGRVQRRGEAMKELGPGEVDYTPPGVEHWHGAAPNSELIQLGIIPGGGAIQFKEEVTDAQYNGQAR
jgi:quercetin dioxygenase-like cupin family protein